jgi:catechol 2,3-dioxygenase-like lactoylglutathione lyase family enzyme
VTIEGIDHVNIRAPAADIAKLKQFYCDVLGLREGWRPPFESRGFWLYAGMQPLVHLVEDPAADTGARAGVDHVAFRTADLESFTARLRQRDIEYRLTEVPALGLRQVVIRDPIGIGVEVTATRPSQ